MELGVCQGQLLRNEKSGVARNSGASRARPPGGPSGHRRHAERAYYVAGTLRVLSPSRENCRA
jgi:hypothetical protein